MRIPGDYIPKDVVKNVVMVVLRKHAQFRKEGFERLRVLLSTEYGPVHWSLNIETSSMAQRGRTVTGITYTRTAHAGHGHHCR